MSKGPGVIESRIAELFAATRDRGLSVAEIADHAFALTGLPATRAQRLSATRAAHRLLRRMKEADEWASKFFAMARLEADAAAGERPAPPDLPKRAGYAAWKDACDAYETAKTPWDAAFKASKFYQRGESLRAYVDQFGSWTRTIRVDKDHWRGERECWRATADKKGTLYFHPPDAPIRVWAVDIQPAGVIWADAEVSRITVRYVTVRYAGDTARLDRESLWRWWALWRNVYFVSSRSGHAAQLLDEMWQERYGRAYDEYGYANADFVPPAMRMPLAEAIALLMVPANFTKDDVLAAFRREVKKAHPDVGGTAEMFDRLVKARDRLLAALGTSAPAPKPPRYAPKGVQMLYRSLRLGGPAKLGSTRRLSAR
jgi:hypothetical protein